MKWIAIAETWKNTNEQVEREVREVVRDVLSDGNGIISGGALGVDFFATDEALKYDAFAQTIKIFLPCSLSRYSLHYQMRAKEGVITSLQAESLIAQMTQLQEKNPSALIEGEVTEVIDKTAYFNRITRIISEADELVAFHVNESEGTQETINKAEKKGIPVRVFKYSI